MPVGQAGPGQGVLMRKAQETSPWQEVGME